MPRSKPDAQPQARAIPVGDDEDSAEFSPLATGDFDESTGDINLATGDFESIQPRNDTPKKR